MSQTIGWLYDARADEEARDWAGKRRVNDDPDGCFNFQRGG